MPSPVKLSLSKYHIKVEDVGFWFWLVTGAKSFLVFLFFKDNAALGTLVGGLLSAGFAFFLTLPLLSGRLPQKNFRWPTAAKLLLAYLLWSAVTLLWTYADSRFIAFSYWAVLALDVLVVFLLVNLGQVKQVAIKSLHGLTWGALILACVALLSPGTEDNRLGNESFLHPNVIGNQLAIASLCSIHLVLQLHGRPAERLRWVLISSVLTFTLLQSLSKTSIISFLGAVMVYIFASKISIKKKVVLALLMVGGIAVSYGALEAYVTQYVSISQGKQLETFTGRTLIWETTWQMIQENPLWGYGFLSFRDYGPQIAAIRLYTAHNEWLQNWFSLGFIGLALSILVYGTYYWYIQRIAKDRSSIPQVTLALALLVYGLIRGTTEGALGGLLYPLPLMLLMLAWVASSETDFNQRKNCG